MDLLAYDKAHGDNLLKTLQVYLETCLQYEKTARQLFVHKNTVRYRIAKCQKFLNTDFTDGKKNFQYTLSLKILEYYHYIE
ncbi:helix-turn-helix domain-containing protein [Coprococcus catus]|nr:helix-turn-helix domain-containing protein [Coprococcus catus]